MKVAVLGGGTAGFMAATHLSQQHHDVELFHVYDSRMPPIGVGEGTTPGFSSWLTKIVPGAGDRLGAECDATPKLGIQFENWGKVNRKYRHDFIPKDSHAVHLSADRMAAFLQPFVRANFIDDHVDELASTDHGVCITMTSGKKLPVDLVVDARGFPAELTSDHVRLSWIPTNAAFVTREPISRRLTHTRAVARPHGWIFVIPLTRHTSYGYVYGTEFASNAEAADDFISFLADENVETHAPPRRINFPNFVCAEPFDGQVFKIGNAASFIEPLEATSIAVVKEQLYLLSAWLRTGELARGRAGEKLRAEVNRRMREAVVELSVFIGWHYAMGSSFDTAFWKAAQHQFRLDLANVIPDDVGSRFGEQLRHAWSVPANKLRTIRTEEELNRLIPQRTAFPTPFGGITPLGFAQIAHGIVDTRRVTAADHLASVLASHE